MPDRERVIYDLERCTCHVPDACRDCSKYASGTVMKCMESLMMDALELLKEQEPVKPTVNVDTWICSKCGHTLESQELIDDNENPQVLIHEQYNYCPNCGKAVKWNE